VGAFYAAVSLTGVVALVEIVVFPYRRCRACDSGKRWSPVNPARNWRTCPVCHGSGKQLRLLARLFRS
jgi:hypothetical protein